MATLIWHLYYCPMIFITFDGEVPEYFLGGWVPSITSQICNDDGWDLRCLVGGDCLLLWTASLDLSWERLFLSDSIIIFSSNLLNYVVDIGLLGSLGCWISSGFFGSSKWMPHFVFLFLGYVNWCCDAVFNEVLFLQLNSDPASVAILSIRDVTTPRSDCWII